MSSSRHGDYPGFRRFAESDAQGYAAEAHFDALKHVLLTRDGCVRIPGAGRGGVFRFSCDGSDFFLRVYRRGGLVRHLIRESYLLQNRALDEFRIQCHLLEQGFPVARLAGIVWRRTGPIYRGAIATVALEGASLLDAIRRGGTPGETTLQASGALIYRLHDLGVYHADLNAANIFLTPNGPHLLDFDNATRVPKGLAPELRRDNLSRLKRSCAKHKFPPEVFASISKGYADAARSR